MPKTNKRDRVNAFIMGGAQARATAQVRALLSKHEMGIGKLDEADYTAAMDKIVQALMLIYSSAMCDTLDVVEGRDLSEIK